MKKLPIFLKILVALFIFICLYPTIKKAVTYEPRETKIIEREETFCEGKLRPDFEFITNVTITMYHPVPGQTDDTPDIVADGTKFDIPTAGGLKWVAVSRDLHSRWGGPLNFGDVVYLHIPEDKEEKSGFYLIKDTMNARFKNRIDILESPGEPIYKVPQAILYLAYREDIGSQQLWEYNTLGILAP